MTTTAIAGFAAALLAASAPPHAAADPRITTVPYDEARVVRITAAPRTATQLRFGERETILHVALGDGAGWEVAAERNVLFLKPLSAGAATNLLVTTDAGDGTTRHYAFDLVSARAGRRTTSTAFVVQFRYPQVEAAALDAALSAQARALAAKVVQLKLESGVIEGPRNLAYALQGPIATSPSEVSDNGRFTVLRFPGSQPVPAVFVVEADGSEALVPFDVRGEFVVVHRVAAQLRLRRGRSTTCIFNQAFDPTGARLSGATASPEVERTAQDPRR